MTNPRIAKPWAVIVTKHTGTRVVFSLFATQAEARAASARLNGFGLVSRVELIRAADTAPGATVNRQPDPEAA